MTKQKNKNEYQQKSSVHTLYRYTGFGLNIPDDHLEAEVNG